MSSMLSIPAFVAQHAISRSLFYKLVKEGRGPRLTKVANRTLISAEAAAEWRARMERETEQVPPRPKAFESHPKRVGRKVATSGQEAA
jgi:hypothetical protein